MNEKNKFCGLMHVLKEAIWREEEGGERVDVDVSWCRTSLAFDLRAESRV